jgi:hypothetical protein
MAYGLHRQYTLSQFPGAPVSLEPINQHVPVRDFALRNAQRFLDIPFHDRDQEPPFSVGIFASRVLEPKIKGIEFDLFHNTVSSERRLDIAGIASTIFTAKIHERAFVALPQRITGPLQQTPQPPRFFRFT